MTISANGAQIAIDNLGDIKLTTLGLIQLEQPGLRVSLGWEIRLTSGRHRDDRKCERECTRGIESYRYLCGLKAQNERIDRAMAGGVLTLADITSADWSLALDTPGFPDLGLGTSSRVSPT